MGSLKKKNRILFWGKCASLIILGGLILFSGLWSSYRVLAYPEYAPSEIDQKIQNVKNQISVNYSKIDRLKRKVAAYQKAIQEKEGKINSLKAQIALLDNMIAKKQIDVQITEDQISNLQKKIDEKTKEIQEQQKAIQQEKARIAAFIRLIYKNSQVNYLEVLIANDSFSDFYKYLTFTKDVEYKLKGSLDKVIALKNKLETDKDILEKNKQNLEKLNKQLKEQEESLANEKETKNAILEQTRYSERVFKRLLWEAKREQERANRDILRLIRIKTQLLEKKHEESKLYDSHALLAWPVYPKEGISMYFHDPNYPFKYLFQHPGIDIPTPQGTPIHAPANGYVGRVHNGGYGYSYIMLIHANGISTVYGHVSKILVHENQFVKRGQIIGLTGGTPGTPGAGRLTTGPHLHFEVRLNGIPVNPLNYLPRIVPYRNYK